MGMEKETHVKKDVKKEVKTQVKDLKDTKPKVEKVITEKKIEKIKEMIKEKLMEKYELNIDQVPTKIEILKVPNEFVPIYRLTFPQIEKATRAVLDDIRERMLTDLMIKPVEVLDPGEINKLKVEFKDKSVPMIKEELPNLSDNDVEILSGILLHKSLGLGAIEIMLQDRNLEEVVINGSKQPIWVYHRSLGWLKTNIPVNSETEIYNYAALIGRRVGTQISHLNPLMDAYLSSGDRANATLFPISSIGNTLTIRKFARRPWTMTDFLKSGTISMDVTAFLWLAIQYEMNIIIPGGTASGKTSMLNALACFISPNHRLISIEDTRELQLPKYLQWIPMTTRPPNTEGKGEITMLQLIINALRMRPDRVIVGEIRRKKEAEVLFEAIHTGHSVYSTVHANTAEEAYVRLTNPPINIPVAMLNALQLIVVMHRDRRRDLRRVVQVTELISSGLDDMKIELNTIFRWSPSTDQIMKYGKSRRAMDEIKMFSGMDDKEIERNLSEKITVLKWFLKNDVLDNNVIGNIVSRYYTNEDEVLRKVQRGTLKPEE
ncbi:MAG: ATPase, T2SS/T4P/T4SS family [Candidatus Aenigmatarchaeota archaeon]|nr:Flp pilus assembly complex ATPase component TadA [Nanoarchaeota archaeon]